METSIKSRKHQHEGIFAKSFKKRKHNNLKRCPLTSAKALNAHMIQHQVNHHNWLPYTERTEMCVCGGGGLLHGRRNCLKKPTDIWHCCAVYAKWQQCKWATLLDWWNSRWQDCFHIYTEKTDKSLRVK